MKRLLIALAIIFAASTAHAQKTVPDYVDGCIFNSTPPSVPNLTPVPFQCDSSGKLLTSTTTTVAGFAPNGTFSQILAGTSTSAVALPSGAVVVIQNQSTTNAAAVNLGLVASVTAGTNMIQVPPQSTVALTVGANTGLAAITSSGTAALTIAGGAGLATGWGGGSGGGGSGGSVTQGTVPWVTTVVGGVTQGGTWNVGVTGTAQVNVNNGVTQGTNPWIIAGTGSGAASNLQVTVAQGISSSTPWFVSGGITPGTLTSTVPLSDPALVDVENSLQAFTSGQLKIPTATTAGATLVGPSPVPYGGAHGSYFLSGGTTNTTNSNLIVAGVHTLYNLTITAPTTVTTAGWLRIYDSASAPTCSSASGLHHVYAVPMGSSGSGGFTIPVGPVGEVYTNGIGFCFTGGAATNDNTAAGNTGLQIDATYE